MKISQTFYIRLPISHGKGDFLTPNVNFFGIVLTIPRTFERENIDVLKKVFHLLEKKRGLVRYFWNKFLSIREKERISHPVFMKVLSKASTY